MTVAMNGSSNVTQVVTHLEAGTEYEYQLRNGDGVSEQEKFGTEDAAVLPYGDFEDESNGPWNMTDGIANPTTFWSSGNNSFC